MSISLNITYGSNVDAVNCAAYDRDMDIDFYDYGVLDSAYNSAFGVRKKRGSVRQKNLIHISARTLDGLITEMGYTGVDLIKIDAESSELRVLEGLKETLGVHKPGLIVEVGDYGIESAPKSEEIISWLDKGGYAPHEVSDGNIIANKRESYSECRNLLFLPQG